LNMISYHMSVCAGSASPRWDAGCCSRRTRHPGSSLSRSAMRFRACGLRCRTGRMRRARWNRRAIFRHIVSLKFV
jgi:hypothetical protein